MRKLEKAEAEVKAQLEKQELERKAREKEERNRALANITSSTASAKKHRFLGGFASPITIPTREESARQPEFTPDVATPTQSKLGRLQFMFGDGDETATEATDDSFNTSFESLNSTIASVPIPDFSSPSLRSPGIIDQSTTYTATPEASIPSPYPASVISPLPPPLLSLGSKQLILSIKGRNLLQSDWLSTMNPLAGIYLFDHTSGMYRLIDQTEVVYDSFNPTFQTQISLVLAEDDDRELMVRIFDVDAEEKGVKCCITEEHVVGTAIIDLNSLVNNTEERQEAAFPLANHSEPLLDREMKQNGSGVILCYYFEEYGEKKMAKSKLQMAISCENLPIHLNNFVDCVPVVSLFRQDPATGRMTFQDQTEKFRGKQAGPRFKKRFTLEFDPNEPCVHKLSVYDTNTTRVTKANRVGSSLLRLWELGHDLEVGTELILPLMNDRFHGKELQGPPYNLWFLFRFVLVQIEAVCVSSVLDHLGKPQFQSYFADVGAAIHLTIVKKLHEGQLKRLIEVEEDAPEIRDKELEQSSFEQCSGDTKQSLAANLSRGRYFRRFFLEKNPKRVSLCLREESNGNGQRFYWCGEMWQNDFGVREFEINEGRSMSMKGLKFVLGKQTEAFKRACAADIEESCCFSIISDDNILNLEAPSARQRCVLLQLPFSARIAS